MNLLLAHYDDHVRGLYRAIVEDHRIDAIPVLVDRLEEVGESPLAEFVRVGLELANLNEVDRTCPQLDNYGRSEPRWKEGVCVCRGCVLTRRQLAIFRTVTEHRVICGRCESGRDREYPFGDCFRCSASGFTTVDLMNGVAWFGELGEVGAKCGWPTGNPEIVSSHKNCPHCHGSGRIITDLTVRKPTPCETCVLPSGERRWPGTTLGCNQCGYTGQSTITYVISGGLLVSVACTGEQYWGQECERCNGGNFLGIFDTKDGKCGRCVSGRVGGIAAELFKRWPVKRDGVLLTGCDPTFAGTPGDTTGIGWHRQTFNVNEPDDIPRVIFDLLSGGRSEDEWRWYDSAPAAQSALAAALWAHGRSLVEKEVLA